MGEHNSSVVFYATLIETMYADVADRFRFSDTESKRDIAEMRSRLRKEGLGFLTKTLPSYGKALDRALSSGIPLHIPGLKLRPGTQLPSFLGELTSRIFDKFATEKSDADPEAVKAYRQLVYLVYKLKYEPTPTQVVKTCKAFEITDVEIGESSPDFDTVSRRILVQARTFTSRVLGTVHPREIIPRHGPGAVATGEDYTEKMNFSRIYSTLEAVYPYTEYFVLNLNQVVDEQHLYAAMLTDEIGTAKVVLVPKDSRGPRLISCEPLEYQWIQQGLASIITSKLESHRLTKGHVNFTDQSINRRLALEGSLGKPWVTLDMKDASDRVATWLVKELFCGTELLEGLLAARTTQTRLPDGRIMTMNKFAPMGSALCFPVEAFIFYALCVSTLVVVKRYPWRKALDRVYVYGDDIIMHSEDYAIACQYLPEFKLMFNISKCCTAGFFRESCGCDAYKGVDVTPVKLRSVWTRRLTDPASLESYIAFSNALYNRGYQRSAQYVENYVCKAFGPIPTTSELNPSYLRFCRPSVCARAYNQSRFRFRVNRKLQRLEMYAPYSASVLKRYHFSDRREMFRRLLSPNKHTDLGTYAVPHRSCLKWGWHAVA